MTTSSPFPYPLEVAAGNAPRSQAYTCFTLPFPVGVVASPSFLRIQSGEGEIVPNQCWPLAYWPDGSLRAVAGVARLPGGRYEVSTSSRPLAVEGLRLEKKASGYLVSNGKDRIAFPQDTLVQGEFDLYLDVVWGDGTPGLARVEPGIQVRHEGPLFIRLERWVVVSAGEHHLKFRLQFDFYHQCPGMAVNLMLIHDSPNIVFQEIRKMELRMEKPGTTPVVFQEWHGFEYLEGRFVEPDTSEEPVDIRVDESLFYPYVANAHVLKDDTQYPFYLRPPAHRVHHVVFLKDRHHILAMEVEDFHLLRPKGLFLEPGRIRVGIWPEWSPPLHLQQGKRRQIRIALHWGEGMLPKDRGGIGAATASLLELHRAQLPPEIYANLGFFDQARVLPYRPDKYPRLEGWIQAASTLQTVADFFHLGDTPDGHYQTTYIPLGYSQRKAVATPSPFFISSAQSAQSYPPRGNYEPIWINNEYDVLFALGTEYLRSGNRLLFQQLRWFARHTIEVDFVCYSDFPVQHRSQPAHSEHHTSTGAYPSHFWNQGLAQYYFLSGDEDALEVIRALGDKTIWYFEHPMLGKAHSGINREMGWALLTLISACEVTGNPIYCDYAEKLISAALQEPFPLDVPHLSFGHTSFLLGLRAFMEAFPDAPLSRIIWDWYLQFLDIAIHSSRQAPKQPERLVLKLSYDHELAQRGDLMRKLPRSGVLSGFAAPDCLAYAYERTKDLRYLEAGVRALQGFLDSNVGYYHPGTFSSFHHPIAEGKPFAVAYRSWIAYFGSLHRADKLSPFDYPDPGWKG